MTESKNFTPPNTDKLDDEGKHEEPREIILRARHPKVGEFRGMRGKVFLPSSDAAKFGGLSRQ